MTPAADLTQLLRDAHHRYRTLRSVWRVWRHNRLFDEAFIADAERTGGTIFTLGRERSEPSASDSESRLCFWQQQPDRMREERASAHGSAEVTIQVGSTWWSHSEQRGTTTNHGDPSHGHGIGQLLEGLLRPVRVVDLLDFDVRGSAERAGRTTLHAQALPRSTRGPNVRRRGLRLLGAGADEYDLEIDADRGIILRAEARLAGASYSIIEVTEIAFDEDLDPQLFGIAPPARK